MEIDMMDSMSMEIEMVGKERSIVELSISKDGAFKKAVALQARDHMFRRFLDSTGWTPPYFLRDEEVKNPPNLRVADGIAVTLILEYLKWQADAIEGVLDAEEN